MIEAENKIFEEARQEMLNEERLLNRDINNGNEDENNFIQKENEEKEGNDNLKEDDKEKNDESVKMEKNLFIDNGGEEDINFD